MLNQEYNYLFNLTIKSYIKIKISPFLLLYLFATLTTLSCKSKPHFTHAFLKISDFGGKGDGVSNNYQAFTKVLIEAEKTGVEYIFLDKGEFLVEKQILGKSRITLKGVPGETIIKPSKDFKDANLFWFNKSQIWKNIIFEDIIFDGSLAPTVTALRVDGIPDVPSELNEVTISNCKFYKLNAALISNGLSLRMTKNTFENVKHGIAVTGCYECKILDNYCFQSINCFTFNDTEGAISERVIIGNNTINKITNYPIHFSDVSKPFHKEIYIHDNVIISDTLEYTNSTSGGSADMISIFGCDGIKIERNTISGGGDMGITLQRSQNAEILGNEINFNARSGIVISSLGGKQKDYGNIYIQGNTINNNSQFPKGGHSAARSGIYIEDDNYSGVSIILGENKIFNYQNKYSNQIYDVSSRIGINSSVTSKGYSIINANETLLKQTKIIYNN